MKPCPRILSSPVPITNRLGLTKKSALAAALFLILVSSTSTRAIDCRQRRSPVIGGQRNKLFAIYESLAQQRLLDFYSFLPEAKAFSEKVYLQPTLCIQFSALTIFRDVMFHPPLLPLFLYFVRSLRSHPSTSASCAAS